MSAGKYSPTLFVLGRENPGNSYDWAKNNDGQYDDEGYDMYGYDANGP